MAFLFAISIFFYKPESFVPLRNTCGIYDDTLRIKLIKEHIDHYREIHEMDY